MEAGAGLLAGYQVTGRSGVKQSDGIHGSPPSEGGREARSRGGGLI